MRIRQLLIDAQGCSGPLDDPETLMAAMRAGVSAVGATEVGCTTVRYVPHGVTLALILAESHVVLSTWPEHRLALLDILLCNDGMDPEVVWAAVERVLRPAGARRQGVERGHAAPPAPPRP